VSFFANTGLIQIKDGDTVVFDSNERLFQCTDFISGSVTLPGRVATYNGSTGVSTPVDVYVGHLIGYCNYHADTVFGSFKVTAAAPQGVVDLGWFNADGSYVHYQGANYQPATGSGNFVVAVLVTYTFRASGGGVYINERAVMFPQATFGQETRNTTLLAPTFTYKLYVGSFV
jgi:hypothetical protein